MHIPIRQLRAALLGAVAACALTAAFPTGASGTEAASAPAGTRTDDGMRKSYDLPAGDAASMLKRFSEISGRETLFAAEAVRGVKTNPVRGELTAREAIAALLDGTGLTAIADEKTGALAVKRDPDPNDRWAAQAKPNGDRPGETTQTEGGTVSMESYEVTGSRLRQTEVEGPSPVLSFDAQYLNRSGFGTLEEFLRTLPQNFTATATGRLSVPNDENPTLLVRSAGQSGISLRGLGSNSTLILIDGRRAPLSGKANASTTPPQSFFDVNTIPFGMIERIEVLTDGASAIYGTDAIGGVINIILKKNYNRTEVRARVAGTMHGGGFERGVTLTSGYNSARMKGTLVLDLFEREALQAKQRWFSSDGDLRPRGGDDQRSAIGYPLTVFALPGQTLHGLTDPVTGGPVTQAVAPSGTDGRNLTVADFQAGAGQRTYYNQADLYSLIPPTSRQGLSGTGEYRLFEHLSVFGEAAYTRSRTVTLGNPLTSYNPNGSAALVRIPASNPFNPFGQDLGVAISHEELGPRHVITDTNSWRGLIGLRAELPRGWTAEGSFMYFGQKLFTSQPSLIANAAINALLAQTDPSKALNLFGDFYSEGGTNGPGIYDSIVSTNIIRADSGIYTADAFARGNVWTLPGGDIQVAVGATWERQDRLRVTTAPSVLEPARSQETRDSRAVYVEAMIPIIGKKNAHPRLLLDSLDFQLAARNESIEDAGSTTDPKYAVRWQPFRALLLRASYGTGYRAPALSELERPDQDANQTLTDRLRNNERYVVHVISGSFPNLEPETSKTWNYGFVVNVPKVRGLSIGADFYWKEQKNLTASLGAQTMLDNESLFTERIIRGAPGASDAAAGLPGRITDVDARFSNFGRVLVQGYDFNVNWQHATDSLGRFTFRVVGTCARSYKVAFNPGDPLTERRGQFGFPQKWNGNASVFWDRGRYGASIFCYYQGPAVSTGFSRPIASFTTVDVGGTMDWSEKIRLQGGIGNIFDRAPPFSNSTFGYDPGFHSPKQRTYNASVTYRF